MSDSGSAAQAAPTEQATGPLTGIRVIDLSRALAGPHATMMMGDLGAEVIKVESPGVGDDSRGWGPPFVSPEGGAAEAQSTYFLSANRNKRAISLNFKDDADRAILIAMIDRADVLVENFRPGVLAKLNLDPQMLMRRNPKLIVLSISGFGHDGPEGGRAGYDQIAQGEAGLMSITGPSADAPQKVGVPIGDLLAGMYGAYGVLAALHERDRTGVGQIVRTSLLAAVVGVHAFQGTRWTIAGEVGKAEGNHHVSIAPYGLFRCSDGSVQMAVGSESLWQNFCAAFELDANAPGFATNRERVERKSETVALVEQVFSGLTQQEVLARLASAGVPSGKVRTIDEVYEWEQTKSQGLIVNVAHETLGDLRLPGPPLRFFDGDGAETTKTEHIAPPLLDGNRREILDWLGK